MLSVSSTVLLWDQLFFDGLRSGKKRWRHGLPGEPLVHLSPSTMYPSFTNDDFSLTSVSCSQKYSSP
ncbi:hypothetical protein KC345_g148 [Hortaea werneckii]|nr:hypothetical protein KC345_g148 [Hortaea werneckii]